MRLGADRRRPRTTAAASARGQPLLVISPWAKQNFVDNTFTDQASIPQFIEDNWDLGRIGNESADASAGHAGQHVRLQPEYGHAPAVILDDNTGEVTKMIRTQRPGLRLRRRRPAGEDTGSTEQLVQRLEPGLLVEHSSPAATRGARTVDGDQAAPASACSHRTAKTAIVLTCTTRGGSRSHADPRAPVPRP